MPDSAFPERVLSRVGTTLKEKYRLERVLGVGGMAAVYGGRHRNGNRVAVKVLFPELAADASVRMRFLREGYVANAVEHRGAVRVLDDDATEDGAVFLVMELLEGESLDAHWERLGRRLDPREVAVHTGQLLDVLAAAHAKGIVHRDIKPENLFLTNDGLVKVLDFGIARLREASVSATRSGSLFGTPAYMAPEQALGRVNEVDAQSDLYAVGAAMFTLISGRYVHAAETAEEMMIRSATQQAESLGAVAPETPAAIVELVDRALRSKKAERWPSARAMQQALSRAYAVSFGEPMPATWDANVPKDDYSDEAKTALMESPLMAAEGRREGGGAFPSPLGPPAERTKPLAPGLTVEARTIPLARDARPASTVAGVAASMARADIAPRSTTDGLKRPSTLMIGAAIAGAVVILGAGTIALVVVSGARLAASSSSVDVAPSASAQSPTGVPSETPQVVAPSVASAPVASTTVTPSSVPIDSLPKAAVAQPTARVSNGPSTSPPSPTIAPPPKPSAARPPPKRDPLAP